jgi:hypothetical protein
MGQDAVHLKFPAVLYSYHQFTGIYVRLHTTFAIY